ncbi:metal-dependent phosphohydrolase [Bradyrhizobium sp. dw_411]|uniref:metal-dependent phosphohydrolase n=1 Tax=Bradyrhizobium sp. dw_411 TaxID=2720082 RepID=UPI001BCDE316|nr:metal-dependent phosphohydrolase [Bradyrhizobium sp. dw_411]
MITVPELAADALGDFLGNYMRRRYGSSQNHLVEMVPSIARIALECIGNSDALYHNVEHTMLVTMAGHDILRGRALHNHMPAEDYAHIIIACLTHDIGYVRGLFRGDNQDGYVVDADGRKAALPRGSSDAAMLPYHVDRSKMYVMERLHGIEILDKERIARAVEGTRFPSTLPSADEECDDEASLLRAADLIGQLGDPHYIRKANALFHEFEEAGLNRQLGYSSPADLVNLYPQFYWNLVAPHVQTAIRYLNVTSNGRQWIANLYSNVFRAERDIYLSGPQK